MEMNTKNSGALKIYKIWELDKLLTGKQVLTPDFIDLKWQDLEGNIVKAETKLNSLILSGRVINASDVRDIFVHQNEKKIFYKANLNQQNNYNGLIPKNKIFHFKIIINLSPGINKISLFSRGRYGFTSERKLRILK